MPTTNPSDNGPCLICALLRAQLYVLRQENVEDLKKAQVVLAKMTSVEKNVAAIARAAVLIKHQRDVLYLFIRNCVEEGDMTKDVRTLVESLSKGDSDVG